MSAIARTRESARAGLTSVWVFARSMAPIPQPFDESLESAPPALSGLALVFTFAAVAGSALIAFAPPVTDAPGVLWLLLFSLGVYLFNAIFTTGSGQGEIEDLGYLLVIGAISVHGAHLSICIAFATATFVGGLRMLPMSGGMLGALHNFCSCVFASCLGSLAFGWMLHTQSLAVAAFALAFAVPFGLILGLQCVAGAIQFWRLQHVISRYRSITAYFEESFGVLVVCGFSVMPSASWVLVLSPAVLSWSAFKNVERLAISERERRTDPLTQVANRSALVERFGELSTSTVANGGALAVIVGDLDNFKVVNDTLGHATGDAVLVSVARALDEYATTLDPDAIAARVGGEEFVVVMPVEDGAAARLAADRLRIRVNDAIRPCGCSMSMGVDLALPEESADCDAVLARADAALYVAKQAGKNMVVLVGDEVWRAAAMLDQLRQDVVDGVDPEVVAREAAAITQENVPQLEATLRALHGAALLDSGDLVAASDLAYEYMQHTLGEREVADLALVCAKASIDVVDEQTAGLSLSLAENVSLRVAPDLPLVAKAVRLYLVEGEPVAHRTLAHGIARELHNVGGVQMATRVALLRSAIAVGTSVDLEPISLPFDSPPLWKMYQAELDATRQALKGEFEPLSVVVDTWVERGYLRDAWHSLRTLLAAGSASGLDAVSMLQLARWLIVGESAVPIGRLVPTAEVVTLADGEVQRIAADGFECSLARNRRTSTVGLAGRLGNITFEVSSDNAGRRTQLETQVLRALPKAA